MASWRLRWAGLFLLMNAAAASAGPSVFSGLKKQETPAPFPLQLVADAKRDAVRQVVERPTLTSRSQTENFNGKPEIYRFFLDRPDRACVAWRRLGAKCVSIQSRGNQLFSWADDNAGEVVWETIVRQPGVQVWFAEGKVKPSPVMPLVPVKVVVVMRYKEYVTSEGVAAITHQTEMFIQTDSKAAALVTKMMGPGAQRMAEQGLGQFQFFFAGLCHYLDRHPDQIPNLTREER